MIWIFHHGESPRKRTGNQSSLNSVREVARHARYQVLVSTLGNQVGVSSVLLPYGAFTAIASYASYLAPRTLERVREGLIYEALFQYNVFFRIVKTLRNLSR
jgi:hypothetical protein